ncbi:MAG: oxidoreductase [Glaciimonas sp.]|nr:oxidoreductase [Glaciimonas sp.]
MDYIRVGLIGYGYSGTTFHAPLIAVAKGLKLSRIASSNPERVRQLFPEVAVVTDAGDVIRAADVDLVVIATPNVLHHSLAMDALNANKHVVLEKPFTITAAEGDELVRFAEKRNLVLSVFHNRRWDSDFLTVRHCIASGILGEINTCEIRFDRYRPEVRNRWREQNLPGSGCLYDLGSHSIDQALQLFGLPRKISADIGVQRPGAFSPDYFHLILDYGVRKVILHSGAIVRQAGPRFLVHGSKGSFIKYGIDPQEDALKQGRCPGDAGWGKEDVHYHGRITHGDNGLHISGKLESLPGSYQSYYAGINNAIRGNGPVPVSAAEALQVIKVIECAMLSSKEGRVIPFT